MLIKERLNDDELATFTTSNGWLERFKVTYNLRKTRITGEAVDVPRARIQFWIERLSELTSDYQLKDVYGIWMKQVFFFKALPEKGLVQKTNVCKGGNKSKVRVVDCSLFRCSRRIICNATWSESPIRRLVLLFLDNAPSDPGTFQSKLRNIKLLFLPKCTASRLQPLDAGIIRSFKYKYTENFYCPCRRGKESVRYNPRCQHFESDRLSNTFTIQYSKYGLNRSSCQTKNILVQTNMNFWHVCRITCSKYFFSTEYYYNTYNKRI